MTRIVMMKTTGGPEVLAAIEIELLPPGEGEVRIRHTVIGVNFVDIYYRSGLYPMPEGLTVPGVEGAGVVEEVGAGVDGFAVGDRVAYAGLPVGGYAEARNIPAKRLVLLPDDISDSTAAASMLRGLTAHMLLTQVYPVSAGSTILVHAAAGGLGLILTQWAERLGARVIGTVGSRDKATLASSMGLDHPILYRETDFVAEVRRLTDGAGVDVAFDGIGGDTLLRTLDAVRSFGTVASIGQASGGLPDILPFDLGPRRSIALARPSVFAYANDPEFYRIASRELFRQIASGMRVTIGAEFALEEAATAHRMLEAGATTGSILLRP